MWAFLIITFIQTLIVHPHHIFATMPLSTILSDCRKATLKKLSFIPIAGLKGRLAISDIKQQWTTLILLTDISTVFRRYKVCIYTFQTSRILDQLIKTEGKRGKSTFLIEFQYRFFCRREYSIFRKILIVALTSASNIKVSKLLHIYQTSYGVNRSS